MNILDKFLPVVPWEITVNGQSFGIFHARTAWGAKRYVPMHAREVDKFDAALDQLPSLAENEAAQKLLRSTSPWDVKPDYALSKKYGEDITAGLLWNIEHEDEYVHGVWAVVEVNYKKASRGKTRDERHTFGVVSKYEADIFIAKVKERWDLFAEGLLTQGKPIPSISELEFTSWIAHIGWAKFGKQIDNYDIESRYGRIDAEKAFKQLKSL